MPDIYVSPHPSATVSNRDVETAGRTGSLSSPYTSIYEALVKATTRNLADRILINDGHHFHGKTAAVQNWRKADGSLITVEPAGSNVFIDAWSYSGAADPITAAVGHFRFNGLNFTAGWKVPIRGISANQQTAVSTDDTEFTDCDFGGGVMLFRCDGIVFRRPRWINVSADCLLIRELGGSSTIRGDVKNVDVIDAYWEGCGPTSGTDGKDGMQFGKCSGTWRILGGQAVRHDPFDIAHTDVAEILLPTASNFDLLIDGLQARGGSARFFIIPQNDFAGVSPPGGMGKIRVQNVDLGHERVTPPTDESVLKIIDFVGDAEVVQSTFRTRNGGINPDAPALMLGSQHAGTPSRPFLVAGNIIDGAFRVTSGSQFVLGTNGSGWNTVPPGGYVDTAVPLPHDVTGVPTYRQYQDSIDAGHITNRELAPGSVGVDDGPPLSHTAIESIDRFGRPRGSVTDCGAYERDTAGPPPPPPPPPTVVPFAEVDVDHPIETWHQIGTSGEPGFAANWRAVTDYTIGYRIDPEGVVHLRGLVERTTSTGAFPATVFTLPVGYRPAQSAHLLAVCATAGTFRMVRVVIAANGTVTLQDPVAGAFSPTVGTWVSLDDIAFRSV